MYDSAMRYRHHGPECPTCKVYRMRVWNLQRHCMLLAWRRFPKFHYA
jgi:hypothetical protein